MTIISPSILSADFMNLGRDLEKFKKESDIWIHLDVMDGHYVPNLTFGAPVLRNIKSYTSHPLDAHLMVENPQDYIEPLKKIGVHNFTFHWEVVTHHDSFISDLKKSFKSVGVSINPGTNIKNIPEYIFEKIDLVLVMSVNPGFGGQSFIESSIDKIEYLHNLKTEKGLNLEIQVDGGVSNKNAKKLVDAGATNLVAGSFIFSEESGDYSKRINQLRE